MNETGYPFYADSEGSFYTFESLSPNKKIQKLVLITPTGHSKIFNVALLDVLDTRQISDLVESNNGDLIEVLVTVFHIIEDFLEHNPECAVMFKGSDARRHRLYRVVLGRELQSLSRKYQVFGGTPILMAPLIANRDYEYYFIRQNSNERSKDV